MDFAFHIFLMQILLIVSSLVRIPLESLLFLMVALVWRHELVALLV